MSIRLEISQEIDIRVDWLKLADAIRKRFNIQDSIESIAEFLYGVEQNYLTTEAYEPEIEEERTNDLTEELVIRDEIIE